MNIDLEKTGQRDEIRRVIEDAFGRTAEADLFDALHTEGDLVISLIASDGGDVCGYVALSRLASPPRALALAPLAVLGGRQRQGIGSRLVRRAIELARTGGSDIVFVLGAPAYYQRFGFTAEAAAGFSSPYAGPHFMALPLSDRAAARAPVIYADAFSRLP